MKTEFRFDKKTGTMVPVNSAPQQTPAVKAVEGVEQRSTTPDTRRPAFSKEKQIEVGNSGAAYVRNRVVKIHRVDKPSSLMLVDKGGKPESYLDTVDVGVVMFKEREDYDICQIADERTGTPMAYIGGYALKISFNMAELNTMEKIEQCLEGITKLFRHKIMTQELRPGPGKAL